VAGGADELLVGAVDERRRVERLGGALPEPLAVGEGAELVVDEREQLVERFLAAFAHVFEERGDVLRRTGRHGVAEPIWRGNPMIGRAGIAINSEAARQRCASAPWRHAR